MPPIRRRMQREMDLALSSNAEEEPSIFALDADCMEELFDYLPLRDLCSVGRTCKRLHRAAGKYFTQNYPFEAINFKRNYTRIERIERTSSRTLTYKAVQSHQTNFANYARRVVIPREIPIHGDDNNVYNFIAASNYSCLKNIRFDRVNNFTEELSSCIIQMNFLAQVSTIVLTDCSPEFCNSLLSRILQSFANLTNLVVRFCEDDSQSQNLMSDWRYQHCPTLERFELVDFGETDFNNSVEDFLRANPQIKKLKITYNDLRFDMIQTLGMELDELEYDCSSGNEARDQMLALIQNEAIKSLTLWVDVTVSDEVQQMITLKDVGCLSSVRACRLYDDDDDYLARIAEVVKLKKLYLNVWAHISAATLEILSKSLVNLEELHLGQSLFGALPFGRRLPKLRIITAQYASDSDIDLKALNEHRMKLPDAEVLKIYLDDEAYNQVRWASIDLFYDLVEVRRFRYKGYDNLHNL